VRVDDGLIKNRRKNFDRKTPMAKFGLETSGLAAAEIVSSAVSLGVFAYADKVAPDTTKKVTSVVAKLIEPYLDVVENVIGTICRLDECKPDKSKKRHERAELMAHNLVLFGAAFLPSLAVKLAIRRGINEGVGLGDENKWWKIWKPSKHDGVVFAWDEFTHLGSLVLLNTGVAKYTDEMIRGSTSVIQKIFGVSEKKAHEIASMTMIWELPNILGLAAGTGAIAHKHLWSAEAKRNIAAAANGRGPALGH
jgi:hypothetical protein